MFSASSATASTTGLVSVPTLTVMAGTARLFAARGLRSEDARESVAKLHDAGIRVLAGTDANSAPGAPFAPKHEESLHQGLGLLVRAGLSSIEALTAATSRPAGAFSLEGRGVIGAGKRADLALEDGDPAKDVTATRDIRGVWIAGERIR